VFGGWLAAGALTAMPTGVIGTYVSFSPRLLKEWEPGVLLRLGRASAARVGYQLDVPWRLPAGLNREHAHPSDAVVSEN
jgi:hypothetical protein